MTVQMYGIANCTTVRRARAWCDAAGIACVFHDYKKAGVPESLTLWAQKLGWDKLINRAGTTFRKLDDADKADLDQDKALHLMRAHPSLIKRPLLCVDDRLLLGFSPDTYADFFGHKT